MVIKTSYCKKCQNKRSRASRRKREMALTDSVVINRILARRSNRWTRDFIVARPRLIEIERNLMIRKRRNRNKSVSSTIN